MRILVSGGSGVLGIGTISALLRRQHRVRLLSRHAERDAGRWLAGVEAWQADVSDADTLHGAADGCDAVLHLAAIVAEEPPHSTFQRVNVDGTRNLVDEAQRAGVRCFVYVSSLGANRGSSPYHASKRAGERIVKTFRGDWIIVRPGAVYGPGDRHLSLMLRMVRSLPVFPLVGGGEQPVQPAWHEDVAEALALSVSRHDLAGREIDIAGPEVTTIAALVRQMRALTGRKGASVPVPAFLATLAVTALKRAGVPAPVGTSQLEMLVEGNAIPEGRANGLTEVFQVSPTPLSVGLKRLLTDQAASLPSSGVGKLVKKRFWTVIQPASLSPEKFHALILSRFGEFMSPLVDVGSEPGTGTELRPGATLVLALPIRGNVLVRVAEISDHSLCLLTVQGHPLTGAVRFEVTGLDDGLLLDIAVYERAASIPDLLAMQTVGAGVQDATWHQFVGAAARAAGAADVEVRHEARELRGADSEAVEAWIEELSLALDRRAAESASRGTDTHESRPIAP